MKHLLKTTLYITAILFSTNSYSQVWMSRNANITFFSETPIENIDAISKSAQAAINTQTGKVFFKVVISSFEFKKALMQEHFNENYMESEKFPSAEFDGQIENLPDLTVDGTYPVAVKGKLTIHGIVKERTVNGTITVSKDKITSFSKFKVKCADHNIEIPKLVLKNIAEEIEVTITSNYTQKK